MTVKQHWDRNTRQCCKADCPNPRAPQVADEPPSLMCTAHVEEFLARVEALANAHGGSIHSPEPVSHRTVTVEDDKCRRCGEEGMAAAHAIGGC